MELRRGEQPRLDAVVAAAMSAARQPLPSLVFLLVDANAFVGRPGGVLGLGRERILGIGLPLLDALTVRQVEGVLLHEAGHELGRDTGLGALAWQVRAAMVRTMERGDASAVLAPYVRWFLRRSAAGEQQQEVAADRLAVAGVGRDAHAAALTRIEVAAAAWSVFLDEELAPALDGGVRPPVLDGHRRPLASPRVADRLVPHLARVLEADRPHPFASHPPLRLRLEAVSAPTSVEDVVASVGDPATPDGPQASGLLDGVHRLEAALLDHA